MINRQLQKNIEKKLNTGKAIILLGARQVGKTTLLKNLFQDKNDVLWLNADEEDVRNIFSQASSTRLKAIFGSAKVIVVDEAQRIPDVGLRFKLITDEIPEVQLIASGSSAFELANNLNEPLTGRKWEFHMYPISFSEMVSHHGLLAETRMIPHRLLYGYYPEIVNNPGNEISFLKQLTDSFLYKDILMLEQIKKSETIITLLKALALQIGNQVSSNELAQICKIDSKTIDKYISLLEKSYIIFRLNSYAKNVRNELKKSKKIYFYDLGIRNALINNFNQIENRQDIGALWENFLIAERLKQNQYTEKWRNTNFWRNTEQNEIDYIEEYNDQLYAYEFKWNPNAKVSISKSFIKGYPDAQVKVIHKDNFDEFLID